MKEGAMSRRIVIVENRKLAQTLGLREELSIEYVDHDPILRRTVFVVGGCAGDDADCAEPECVPIEILLDGWRPEFVEHEDGTVDFVECEGSSMPDDGEWSFVDPRLVHDQATGSGMFRMLADANGGAVIVPEEMVAAAEAQGLTRFPSAGLSRFEAARCPKCGCGLSGRREGSEKLVCIDCGFTGAQ